MKKNLLLIVTLILITFNTLAQDNNAKYIVVNSQTIVNGHRIYISNGISERTGKPYTTTVFILQNCNMFFDQQKDIAPIKKPSSFLKTISYDDWDELRKTVTRTTGKEKRVEYQKKYENLYLIDRKDTKNDTITIYKVKALVMEY